MWSDRRPRALTLAGSLLLNVLLVGIVAGHLYGARASVHPRRGELPLIPPFSVGSLPADQRGLFRDTMGSHHDSIRALRQEHRRLKRRAEDDIAAEPFDAAKVAADLAALREAGMAVQTAANAALVEALGKLAPAARVALVRGPIPPDTHR